MVKLGVGTLSSEELLAIFLRTGVRGASAISIGRQLLRKHGSLGVLSRLSLGELARETGIGPAKACQLMAAIELGARVAREEIYQQRMSSPDVIYDHLSPIMGAMSQEVLMVLVLDSRLGLIRLVEVTRGLVNETLAHPREVLRPVIEYNGSSFMVAHNHPSGDPSPSSADLAFTKKLAEAADIMSLRFLDHLIIGQRIGGASPYFSFREAGLVDVR